MIEIKVTPNEAGQRCDKLLAKFLKEAPKSFLYKMLRKKNIVLNGKKATGNEILLVDDLLTLYLSDETIEKFSKSVEIFQTTETLPIILETKDIILFNKPTGMLSQRAEKEDVSVNEYLISYLFESKQLTKEELKTFRPAVCNRLDRNTSGLIIAGKTLAGLQKMSAILNDRSIEKYYRCVVYGRLETPQKIEGYLLKNETTNQVKILSTEVPDSKYIETEYQPIFSSDEYSILEVHLITGRTHQIRAHLASIGHSIIGDPKYGLTGMNKKIAGKWKLTSQLLHSYRMVFPELTDEFRYLSKKEVIAPEPAEFSQFYPGRQE